MRTSSLITFVPVMLFTMSSLRSVLFLLLLSVAAALPATAQFATKVRQFPRNPGGSIQGMCITPDGYLIQAYNRGQCRIFDLKREGAAPIAEFPFASAGKGNHANCVSLSETHLSGNGIPLLYITGGQPNDGVLECNVENILKSDQGYQAKRVQRITLSGEFVWDMKPSSEFRTADGFYKVWGAPNFIVDSKADCLFVFSAVFRTTKAFAQHKKDNRYVVTKLRLPKPSEGDVTLTRKDVLGQILFDYDVFVTQSGCVRDAKIYYVFGFGRDRASLESSQLRVYDLPSGKIAQRIDLAEEIPEELESCSFYKDELYVMTQKGNLYKITL